MVEKAIDELEVLSRDEITQMRYEEQLKAEFDYNSGIDAANWDGENKGKFGGKLETARKMKEYGDSIEKIIFITGLSETQLREDGIV